AVGWPLRVEQNPTHAVPRWCGTVLFCGRCGFGLVCQAGDVYVQVTLKLTDVLAKVGPYPVPGKLIPWCALDLHDDGHALLALRQDQKIHPAVPGLAQGDRVLGAGVCAQQAGEECRLNILMEVLAACQDASARPRNRRLFVSGFPLFRSCGSDD